MPRIDPIKLLNCLSVLLLPNGGIKGTVEVKRLAEMMTKYSKKLVSKCIYIQILKYTETSLLDLFMVSDGWSLVHLWLTESIVGKNWPLAQELLELLLLCPVDIERLKTNNCPKLVKELSKDENHFAIKALALKLVEQWLKIVKGEQPKPILMCDIPKIISDINNEEKAAKEHDMEKSNYIDKKLIATKINNEITDHNRDEQNTNSADPESSGNNPDAEDESTKEVESLPVLKITLKNGKQILSHVDDDSKVSDNSEDKNETKDKNKNKSRDKTSDRSSSNSSKSSSSKHSNKSKSSSDKHHSHKDSSSKHSSSSSSSSKDKRRDKDRYSSSSQCSKSKSNYSSTKRTSSSSKLKEDKNTPKLSSDKEKTIEKDKVSLNKEKLNLETEEKPKSPSIHKLGKIPKLSDVKREKPSISIEVRKPEDPKPKTVKTFHSKFRKHGLEEEVRPPPSRASVLTKKPLPALPPTVLIPKRPSPIHNESPPEKKPKTIDIDKPGAIKLIPPKPKPMVLQESDLFMDALNASATNKKEPKKRKRRTSGSKDGTSNDSSPPHTPTNTENKSVPPKFYQDTLDEEEPKEKSIDKESEANDNADKTISNDDAEEKIDVVEPHTRTVNGIKGVLWYHKRKGPKKSIRWKPEPELEEIQYFELDETERVNVTKTFTDMKHLERINEREAFQKARNLTNDDLMEAKTSWRPLIYIDCGEQVQVEYGKNSKERDIQAIRQKGTLQPLYFHKAMIPDSPVEPDLETHTYIEPTNIPLDDITGNVSDFRNMPWPEPKGNPPPTHSNINVPPLFPSNIPQFPNNFPPTQFSRVPGVPGFQGPPILPGDWQNNVPPVMANGLPGPIRPPVLPPGSMPPRSMPPGSMPPGSMPPGSMPPGSMPPGSMPPGSMTPGSMPPGSMPPGSMPPGSMPPGSMPPGGMPPGNMPPGGMPPGNMPPGIFGGLNPMFQGPPEGFNMPQNMFPGDFMSSPPPGPGPDGFGGPGNFRGGMRGRAPSGHWRGNGNFDGPLKGRGGSRGGRKAVCIHFQRKGSCRQGDSCSFLHPGVNCPY